MKKITLEAWTKRHYDPPPSAWMLRRWTRDGEITPPPERVGRCPCRPSKCTFLPYATMTYYTKTVRENAQNRVIGVVQTQ